MPHKSIAALCGVALSLATILPVALPAQSHSGTPSQKRAVLKQPPTADSLAQISWRGRTLAEYDFAAWRSTDSVLARRPADGVIQTYIARQDKSTGDWQVAFGRLSANRDTFLVAYETRQMKPPQWRHFAVQAFTPARADTGFWLRAARAIEIARVDFGRVTRPYNTAIIERMWGDFWVYMMPAQTRAGVYPVGGDVRYLVSKDGRTILQKRRLHNEVLEYAPRPESGSTLEANMRVAVLDDIPEDTDVFHVMVRQPQVTEYIVTDAFVYSIRSNGEIKLHGRREEVLGKDPQASRKD